MNPPIIPTAMITKVNDVDQAPTPNTEAVAPSTGMPELGPWHSNQIADLGT